ncbi:MAG: T9SS type A sorting domain-containing protein [Bacteroidota bacterium]|nr:T9SS type A sorting domain-containing protein [Bacteroidota bacterium]
METIITLSQALNGLIKKVHKAFLIIVFTIALSFNSSAHTAQPFVFGCVTPGSPMTIDAIITSAGANTNYHWQYKVGAGPWTCFVNGINNINGTNFAVSGATGVGANDAPLLTINSAAIALENVLVRVLMGEGADPCVVTSPVWGGDNEALDETKYLRLHVFSNAAVCPPNAYLCVDNKAISGNNYYGGFENISFNAGTSVYTRNNFGGVFASSDFSFGTSAGSYQDINNPYAMNTGFARNIAPHTGNYQLVVRGSSSTTARSWYKSSMSVMTGSQYAFAVWAVRVDATDPIINLKITTAAGATTTLITYDMGLEPVGSWKLIQGRYTVPPNTTSVTLSINDSRPEGLNNYSLDDICFRECTNCATLPLHQLDLKASLQGSNVALKWIAENEMNTSNFVIERSTDGINYNPIGSAAPSGPVNTPTEYKFMDDIQNMPLTSVVFYRIKAMDNNSRFAYSNVATIRLNKTAGIQIWPNPVDSYVNISYNSATNTKLDISVVNTIGKTVKQTNHTVYRGLNQIAVSGFEILSSGIYFIRITDKNTNEVYMQKISK